LFLSSRKYDPGCSSRIPDPDADFLPIPDPGSRGPKGTGSRIRIRNTVGFYGDINRLLSTQRKLAPLSLIHSYTPSPPPQLQTHTAPYPDNLGVFLNDNASFSKSVCVCVGGDAASSFTTPNMIKRQYCILSDRRGKNNEDFFFILWWSFFKIPSSNLHNKHGWYAQFFTYFSSLSTIFK
jgi:hypothetical protein